MAQRRKSQDRTDLENRRGSAAAFATLSPFRSKLKEWIDETLALWHATVLRDREKNIRERTFLHHALWVKVPKRALKYPKKLARGRRERDASLLFLSYFTDDLFDYLRGFTEKLTYEMDRLWGPCRAWPGAEDYGGTKQFVLNHRFRTDVYFNGRQTLNVGDTRVALATRLALDELATLLDPHVSDECFKEAYDRAVRTAFGRTVRFSSDGNGKRGNA